MRTDQYMDFVDCDAKRLDLREARMLGGMGIAGEAGEVCDILKKVAFHGKPLDHDHLVEELGDVLWYMYVIMKKHGITMDDVMVANVKKLCVRYPDRYGRADEWLAGTD